MRESGFKGICKVVYVFPSLQVLSICSFYQSKPLPGFSWLWPYQPSRIFSLSSTFHSLLTLSFHPRNILKILASLKKKKKVPVTKWLSSSLPISHLHSIGRLLGKGPQTSCPHLFSSHPLLSEGGLVPALLPTEAALAVVSMAIHLQIVRTLYRPDSASNRWTWPSGGVLFLDTLASSAFMTWLISGSLFLLAAAPH